MPGSLNETKAQVVFQRVKTYCVPLLGNALLTPATIPRVSGLLSDLIACLQDSTASGFVLSTSLISYTFFPLSTILRRNVSSEIPNQIFEKIFITLRILCDRWWWDCDLNIWDQIFMLCGAVVGGIEGNGKGKERDDETKAAAAQCLLTIVRVRSPEEAPPFSPALASSRLAKLQTHVEETKFIPVLGQTINSLLASSQSRTFALQRVSLELLDVLVSNYAPDYFLPSVLPGIVSGMCKVALGVPEGKGWAKGDLSAGALKVMQEVIIKSVGDDICIKEGAVRDIANIEDLANLASGINYSSHPTESRPYSTARSRTWLNGTSSQLHIALNSLTPLVSHPNSSALLALSSFSSQILMKTVNTLPQSQALLLSFLLSLSNSTFASVSADARRNLLQLLGVTSKARHSLLQTLMQNTKDNLAALPRLLPLRADAKVEHLAGLIEAVCRLSVLADGEDSESQACLTSISSGVGKLFGPSGGIEKWGWSLLSVLEFHDPPVSTTRTSAAQLMLETSPETSPWSPFPEVTLKNVASRSAYEALIRMFRALGRAAGMNAFFSIEWFVAAGRNGRGSRAAAALWCGCRLLEGAAHLSLDSDVVAGTNKKRIDRGLENLARGLARAVAELWDRVDEDEPIQEPENKPQQDDGQLQIEHVRGLTKIRASFAVDTPSAAPGPRKPWQLYLHRAFCLQLLAITAGVLQARFTSLLLYTLYPVLHSLVSPVAHLSSTALSALNYITINTSHASPKNLLLSNFDYALDAVSRRLTHRWLDVDATKVLVVLVRLVGSDVVQRAGDVVEECFDRLDEYHGYEILVEGLIEVLGEVVKVVESDNEYARDPSETRDTSPWRSDSKCFESLLEWLERRDNPSVEAEDHEDYGPAPRQAFGQSKGKAAENGEDEPHAQTSDPNADLPPTPIQALTKQIVSRSMFFLTHASPVIRARILTLLSSSVPVLPESALLPSIHLAWPFVLNRLNDAQPFVVGAAASLVESLVTHVGSSMSRRVWDDVWPRFRTMLTTLDAADAKNALARRGPSRVGTESAYTHSHRLYRSLLRTMTAALKGIHLEDNLVWEVALLFRRFLHCDAHEELQRCARQLYVAIGANNDDAVWLALSATVGDLGPPVVFLAEPKWDIAANVNLIFAEIASNLGV